MLRYKYKQITNKRQFDKNRREYKDIKWIVVHATANSSIGANADAHYRYLQHAKRYGSAHYYVDDNEIIQTIGDSQVAWSCGDSSSLNGCTNYNSLAIEMCMNADSDASKVYKNTVELVKNLMIKFKIDVSHVCRHYDVTRKPCPIIFEENNWKKWWQFKQDITKPRELKIDLEKDSVAVPIKNNKGDEKVTEQKERKSRWIENKKLNIIETTADNLYIQQIGGKTLRQTGAYGINGTFYDTSRPELSRSTYMIAVNNGKAIGENAHTNEYNHPEINRGTFIYHEDGTVAVARINNIYSYKRKIKFAVGGLEISPRYDPKEEKILPDIIRYAHHTAIAYKGDKVYLITTKIKMDMYTFKTTIEGALKVDGAVALDGGGSTQMYYENNRGNHTFRHLNNMIGLKKL